MKRGNFTSLVLLSGALALPAFAEKVQFEQLPAGLQEKIRAQVGSTADIQDIDRNVKDGKTIYEVGYKKDGQHHESQFEYSETSAAVATSTSSSASSQKIQYDQLPENVKRVADAQLQGAEVNDVDRQVKNGRTTYEIGYKQRAGGPQRELLISESGEILNQSTTTAGTAPAENQPYRNYRGVIPGQGTSASASARVIDYNQLPSNIRSVAESRLSDGDVSQVQRVIQNGQIAYHIDFKKEDGRNQQLVIAEDGRVLRDQFVAASAVGSAGAVQSGSSSASTTTRSEYANITNPVQLLSAQEITRNQLPVGVARTVRGYTTNANIEEIHRGTWNGKEVYQVSYMDNNNQLVRLQLDANGNIIYDPRNVNSGSTTQNLLNNVGRALFDKN